MLAWEMGVGKTATAARAWELTQESGPLLVICLASARDNWAREIRRFTLDPEWPPIVHVIDGVGGKLKCRGRRAPSS
jgi:SNF2 family DNA or RNA helicase